VQDQAHIGAVAPHAEGDRAPHGTGCGKCSGQRGSDPDRVNDAPPRAARAGASLHERRVGA